MGFLVKKELLFSFSEKFLRIPGVKLLKLLRDVKGLDICLEEQENNGDIF